MTKKVNTGGVNTLATALQNAGVAASDIVVTSAPAAVDAQQQQQQPAPASPQAAIDATTTLAAEIDAAKKVWEHAKASGISKDQFLTFCEIDAEKFAFFKTHKKAIFGSKKQQLEEAAEEIVNVNAVNAVVNKINEAPDYVRRALKLIKKGEQITQYLESLSKAQRKEVKAALIQNYETNKGKKKVADANGYPNIPLMHQLGWRADIYH